MFSHGERGPPNDENANCVYYEMDILEERKQEKRDDSNLSSKIGLTEIKAEAEVLKEENDRLVRQFRDSCQAASALRDEAKTREETICELREQNKKLEYSNFLLKEQVALLKGSSRSLKSPLSSRSKRHWIPKTLKDRKMEASPAEQKSKNLSDLLKQGPRIYQLQDGSENSTQADKHSPFPLYFHKGLCERKEGHQSGGVPAELITTTDDDKSSGSDMEVTENEFDKLPLIRVEDWSELKLGNQHKETIALNSSIRKVCVLNVFLAGMTLFFMVPVKFSSLPLLVTRLSLPKPFTTFFLKHDCFSSMQQDLNIFVRISGVVYTSSDAHTCQFTIEQFRQFSIALLK